MDKKFNGIYEMMHKLNPEFKLNEDAFGNPDGQQGVQPLNTQPIQGDQFQGAFKSWFSSLGYSPADTSITIDDISNNIRTALQSLGYK
jgi:hypothetical protein